MSDSNAYQESCRFLVAREDSGDLYAIHERIKAIIGNQPISYAPAGLDREGRMVVVLRSSPQSPLPDSKWMYMEKGMAFKVNAGVRFVKRSDFGERMPTVGEALEKWTTVLSAGGFDARDTRLVESAIAFYHRRLNNHVRLPFWALSSTLTVVDAEKAAGTMIRGVGRSRGLGFGMLMRVPEEA
jgi:hypothetical protein